ncbi:MAG: type II secretion system F family protein [Candidatus Micrarchaeota archaeon]
MNERPFRRIGAALPGPVLAHFARKLRHAGIREDVRVWLGVRTLLAFCAGSVLMLLYLIIYNPIATPESALIVCGLVSGGFAASGALTYLGLYFRITDRTSAVERILPDLLMLTVSNLRAGMSPFSAFVSASRPEFGALHREVMVSAARASGTSSLVDALREIGENFDSPVLGRIITLFAKGIRSGGTLTKLLHSSAEEVRNIQDLRAELASATRTYVIFLGFIIVLVMPFLLSVSLQFLTVFLRLQAETGSEEAVPIGDIPSFAGAVLITAQEMEAVSLATLVITSMLASCLLGIVVRGRALYGLKYFPWFAIASALSFFMARAVVGSFLSAFG